MLQQWFENTATILDLKAQWDMAEAAYWMLWATTGSIVVGIFGFGALLVSLWQTRSSIRTNQTTAADARDLGQATARAYLHVEDLKFSQDDRAAVITVRNTGSTPAPMLCAGCELKLVPAGRMKDAIVFGSYGYKGWHALPAGTARDFRVEFGSGGELLRENRERHGSSFGMTAAEIEKADKLLVVGRLVWNDVFGQYQETGFAFFTEDMLRSAMRIPAGILPAFRLIDISEVPRGMPVHE